MRNPLVATALLLSGLLLGLANARNTFIRIRHDDRPGIMLSRPFGFNSDPHMDIELSGLHVYASVTGKQHSPDKITEGLKNLRFFVVDQYAEPLEEEASFQRHVDTCRFLEEYKNVITELFNVHDEPALRNMATEKKDAQSTFVFKVPSEKLGSGRGGVYALFMANCMGNDFAVSYDISIKKYNKDARDNPNYLSVGEIELPTMYLIMGCVFTVALGMWVHNLLTHREHAHRIHHLMTALGVFKVLTLLAQCGMYHYIRVTGSPDGWNVAFYIFTLFRGVFLFAVIILIGTGWSYMTPFLSDNNKKVLMVVVPLQVLTELAIIFIDEYTPAKASWLTWKELMHLMDIVCCAAILFPIVWRIKHLREAAQSDGKAAQSLKQLVMFKHFYIIVLCYIYFTRIVVFILRSTLPLDYVWLAEASGELATLVFYTLTALQFRPHAGGGYYQLLNDSEIELANV